MVRLSVRDKNGGQTGSDHGWLIHCDGWLLFEGRRTSFAVSRGEARQAKFDSGLIYLEDQRWVRFSIQGDRSKADALKQVLMNWKSVPIPEGEAVLPPRDPHPSICLDKVSASLLFSVICATVASMAF